MNKYMKEWIDENYPLMNDDIEELDCNDFEKFADWIENCFSMSLKKQLSGLKNKKIKECEICSCQRQDWCNGYMKALDNVNLNIKNQI